MNWLTKHSPARNRLYEQKFVVSMLGVIGMCCALSALADPLKGYEAEIERLGLSEKGTEITADVDLSMISGKGGVINTLENGSKLAVILWDEGGSTKRCMSGQCIGKADESMLSGRNSKTITWTVNQK